MPRLLAPLAPLALLLLLLLLPLLASSASALESSPSPPSSSSSPEVVLLEHDDADEAGGPSLLAVSASALLRTVAAGRATASSADMRRAFLAVAPHGMTREQYMQFFIHSMGGSAHAVPPALSFDRLDVNRDGIMSADEFTMAFAPAATSVHALPATAAHTTTTTTTTAAAGVGHHTTSTSTSTTHAAAAALGGTAHHTTTTTAAGAGGHHTTTTTTAAVGAAHNNGLPLHGYVDGRATAGHHTTTVNGMPLAQPIGVHAGAITSTGATVNGVYYPPGATLPAGYGANGLPLHGGANAFGANGGYTANGVYYPPGTSPSTFNAHVGNGLYASRPTKVDWYAAANSKAHRTTPYRDFLGAHKVVLRRGQTFKIDLVGPASLDFDSVSFTVGTIPVPNIGRHSKFGSKTWGCKVRGVYRNHDGHRRATYTVYLPSVAPIGEFELAAVSPQFQRVPLGTFVVIFNAWSKFDDVYLKDPTYRAEYTYSDSGRMWFGDALDGGVSGVSSTAWNFHQYELLHIVLKIVREFVPPHDRHDPVLVSRVFTWALNNAGHDHGVLEGRWDGHYQDGTKPTAWSGSRGIYQQWASTGRSSKYGQCWVFAGILTTAMRSLGIPCRPVTNFRSAHDSFPFDHVIETDEGESVWNYHVWNEAWMRRRDIGQGFQWNAIDSTPQEVSEGKYQMGPSAIYDVRHNRDGNYDTGFVASEVNAHVWLRKSDYMAGMSARTTDFDTQDVGRLVSTLRPGCVGAGNACRLDLTKLYKNNLDPFTRSRFAEVRQFEHMFTTTITPERPVVGHPFVVSVRRSNLVLDHPSNVQVQLLVESISYTGLPLAVVKRVDRECTLTPNAADPRNTCQEFLAGHAWTMQVSEAEARQYVGVSSSLRATVRIVHIDGQRQGLRQYVWFRQFALVPSQTHHMTLSAPARVVVGQPFRIGIHVNNPLSYPMTAVVAHVDSPDMDRFARFGNIPAHARVKLLTSSFVVSTPGVHQISVSLDTAEYPDLFAGITISATMPAGGYAATAYKQNNLANARKYASHVYDYYDALKTSRGGMYDGSTTAYGNQYDKSTTGSFAQPSYFHSSYNSMYRGGSSGAYSYAAQPAKSSRVAKAVR